MTPFLRSIPNGLLPKTLSLICYCMSIQKIQEFQNTAQTREPAFMSKYKIYSKEYLTNRIFNFKCTKTTTYNLKSKHLTKKM